jgi:hypothetical protein
MKSEFDFEPGRLLDLFRNLRGSLFQKGIEIVREEWLRQVMLVASGKAFFTIRAGPKTAHRDSERFGRHLADQFPSVAVWKPNIADQNIEVGRRDHLNGGSDIPHAADLMPQLLKIPCQVSQAIFVVFNKENSQATEGDFIK